MTWSVHQYHMPRIGAPKKMPVHGKVRIAHRLDHVEVAGGQGGAQPFKAADPVHSDHGKDDGADNQDQGLHQIGINDRRQSSGDGVNAGRDHQDDRGGQRTPAHHAFQHNGRCI